MRPKTRELFDAYNARIAELNNVADTSKKFTVEPSVQQTLRDRLSESTAFLGRINLMLPDEISGEAIGLGVGGLVTSNTDTSGANKRVTTDPITLTLDSYQCRKNNHDTRLKYDKLDQWAKFPDFQARVQRHIVLSQAHDRMRVGFNGVSYALNSNRVANPLGQDVNLGFLQKVRVGNPANVLDSGAIAGKVSFGPGAGADFKTIDALARSARMELIAPWYREGTDLVAMLSFDLLEDKYFEKVNTRQDSTDELATDIIIANRRIGQTDAVSLPYFPAGKLFITSFDNLSIYEQDSSRRRHIKDSPEIDAVENFESANVAYVVEDLDKACLVENIEYKA